MNGRMLSPEEARRVYDRIGAKQDTQGFYEDPAIAAMIAAAEFAEARSVVELGCGTGKLGARLLHEELPPDATYQGFDVSPVMADLAARRVQEFGSRASAAPVDGGFPLPVADASAERFVSTYVLDLLSADQLDAAIAEAARVLVPGGRLCLVSLTEGVSFASRALMAVWKGLHRLSPPLVGGCRPVRLAPQVATSTWEPILDRTVVSWGVPSEVLVARRRQA